MQKKDIPWLVFGMNNRDEKQIKQAIAAGYRTFDCADSYGNTKYLASALKSLKIDDRDDFEVIYKIDIKPNVKDFVENIINTSGLFGKKLDAVIIHNIDGSNDKITEAWKALKELKKKKVVTKIGVGNVRVENKDFLISLHKIEAVDVIENTVASLLLGDTSLVPNLGSLNSKMTVYYYDVFKIAGDIKTKAPNGIHAIMLEVENLYLANRMVLSSSKEARMIENFKYYAEGPGKINEKTVEKETEAITIWKKTAGICIQNKGELKIDKTTQEWLNNNMVKTKVMAELRSKLKEKAIKENKGNWSKEFIQKALESDKNVPMKNLEKYQVPERKGLYIWYKGVGLNEALVRMLYDECQAKVMVELIAICANTIEDYAFIKPSLNYAVKK